MITVNSESIIKAVFCLSINQSIHWVIQTAKAPIGLETEGLWQDALVQQTDLDLGQ